jgi:hypothetical protein
MRHIQESWCSLHASKPIQQVTHIFFDPCRRGENGTPLIGGAENGGGGSPVASETPGKQSSVDLAAASTRSPTKVRTSHDKCVCKYILYRDLSKMIPTSLVAAFIG